MSLRQRGLLDGTVPGTNLGDAFTASIAERQILQQSGEAYLDDFLLSYKGVGAVAIVTLTSFLDLVNPFVAKFGVPLIALQGRDIFALSTAWYGQTPRYREGAAAANDHVAAMRIPVHVKLKATETNSFFVTRVAVTNISAEVLRLTGEFLETPRAGGRYDIRAIPDTLPATAGLSQRVPKLPKLGKLLGLLVFCTTVPTAAADTSSIQRLQIGNS